MHDKELDDLFGSKLKHLHIAPDHHVWKGIALELDGAKRKGKLWQVVIIALVVVAILAGCLMLLLPTQNAKNGQKQTNPVIVVDKQEVLSR